MLPRIRQSELPSEQPASLSLSILPSVGGEAEVGGPHRTELMVCGFVLGFPKSIKSREKLSEYLTVVIFTASAQHAAVNFGQVGLDSPFWGRTTLGSSQWEPSPTSHLWPRLLAFWPSHNHAQPLSLNPAVAGVNSACTPEAPTRPGHLWALERRDRV